MRTQNWRLKLLTIMNWTAGQKDHVQLIYFNYRNNHIMAPVNEEFRIKSYKAFKAENYKSSVFFEE